VLPSELTALLPPEVLEKMETFTVYSKAARCQ